MTLDKNLANSNNLQQIAKVETAATGHSEVLKADVNTFFDKLVRSIEGRRKLLLTQVEAKCQKDMKQIWADKEFHKAFISQISSVFGLADKACKCTSDVDMILTALQSIDQLTQLKSKDWDSRAFVNVVLSTPKFTEGEKVALDAVGAVGYSSTSSTIMKLSTAPTEASLGGSIQFCIHIPRLPTQQLIDNRSGTPVDLQLGAPKDLNVTVCYGNAGKKLDNVHISLAKRPNSKPYMQTEVVPYVKPEVVPRQGRGRRSQTTFSKKKAGTSPLIVEDSYDVTIRVVCGGEHNVTFSAGGFEVKHTFSVVGHPSDGMRVKKGPDWKPPHSPMPTSSRSLGNDEIGTVYDQSYYSGYNRGYNMDVVRVEDHLGTITEYKWGQDGMYEVELL